MEEEPRRELIELSRAVPAARVHGAAARVRVGGLATDTRRVREGDLYIAVRGTTHDGHDFVSEAVRRGAAAVVAERPVGDIGVPVLQVPDSRAALVELAAEWHGRPAAALRLVGITGTLGKTSVLSMLEAILTRAARPIAAIGSLGVRSGDGRAPGPPLTTPDPITLHAALAEAVRRGMRAAAMEVTSHALDQGRVAGLEFGLGIFTNLTLLEHLEYHGSFRSYVEAKRRFFACLRPGAPLVYPAGDRIVRALIRGEDVTPVSCGAGGRVSLRIERLLLDRGGTRVVLTVREPIDRPVAGRVASGTIPLELKVLGRPNVANAALAATAALCLGAEPEAVRAALAEFPAPWRRMQIVHRGHFTVLDDTVGHPDSISAVFEVAGRIRHRGLHVVYAIRGRRGEEINRRDAETIAIWSRRVPLSTLIVTSAGDATDEANVVESAERDAFLGELRRKGCGFEHHERLEEAIGRVVERTGAGDLVLLLGAQGMNRGAAILRAAIGERIADPY